MRLSHPDYVKLVIEEYKKKRVNKDLSPLLAQSTPANVRRECANVCQERYDKKDNPTLRAFFGPAEDEKQFLAVIRDLDVNKFKPLDNFLKGAGQKGINDRNLELLAWLIDFKYRPYSFDNNVVLNDIELTLIGKPKKIDRTEPTQSKIDEKEQETERENLERHEEESADFSDSETIAAQQKSKEESKIPSIPGSEDNKRFPWVRKSAVVLVILLIFTGGIFTIWMTTKENAGCMYWSNDHYVAVPCNEEHNGGLILPLNEEKMKNFRKITREDTITEKSIGIIYYLKTDTKPDYFTTGGNHPVYVNRPLKILSRYMFDKYISKKENAGPDSLEVQKK